MSGYPVKSILVVDDQIMVLKSIQTALKDSAINLYTLSDSRHVVSFLQQHPEISLVLLDTHLPFLNGVALLNRLQNQFPTRFAKGTVSVKFISGYSKDEIYRTIGEEVDEIISKPLKLSDIKNLLETEFTPAADIGSDQVSRIHEINDFKRKELYKGEHSLDDFF